MDNILQGAVLRVGRPGQPIDGGQFRLRRREFTGQGQSENMDDGGVHRQGVVADGVGQQQGVAAGGQAFLKISGNRQIAEGGLHPQDRFGKRIVAVAADRLQQRPGVFQPAVQFRGRMTDENRRLDEVGQRQNLSTSVPFLLEARVGPAERPDVPAPAADAAGQGPVKNQPGVVVDHRSGQGVDPPGQVGETTLGGQPHGDFLDSRRRLVVGFGVEKKLNGLFVVARPPSQVGRPGKESLPGGWVQGLVEFVQQEIAKQLIVAIPPAGFGVAERLDEQILPYHGFENGGDLLPRSILQAAGCRTGMDGVEDGRPDEKIAGRRIQAGKHLLGEIGQPVGPQGVRQPVFDEGRPLIFGDMLQRLPHQHQTAGPAAGQPADFRQLRRFQVQAVQIHEKTGDLIGGKGQIRIGQFHQFPVDAQRFQLECRNLPGDEDQAGVRGQGVTNSVNHRQAFGRAIEHVDAVHHQPPRCRGVARLDEFCGHFNDPAGPDRSTQADGRIFQERGCIQLRQRGAECMHQQTEKVDRVPVRSVQVYPGTGRAGLAGDLRRQGRLALGRLTGNQHHTGMIGGGYPLDQPRAGNRPGQVRKGCFGVGAPVCHGMCITLGMGG